MKIAFTEAGWEDYLWFQQNDRKRLKRINTLITNNRQSHFIAIGAITAEGILGETGSKASLSIKAKH